MDRAILVNFIVITVTAIIISVKVIGIILMNQSISAAASGVVILIAMMTESSVFVAIAIVRPDSFTTSVAGCGMTFKAVYADNFAIYSLEVFVFTYQRTAMAAI